MKYLIIFIIFVLFSCSTTSNVNKTEEVNIERNKQRLYYTTRFDFGYFGNIMLKKGFRRKKENEGFGDGLYSFTGKNKEILITSDKKVLMTALRFFAFSMTSFSYCASGPRPVPILLKVNVDNKDIDCLTTEPFEITGTNNKFFSPGECGIREAKEDQVLGLHVKIKDIPSVNDVFVIDQTTYKKHCISYNPNNRFMKISRDVLMEEYFWKFDTKGIYKFACIDEINPKFRQNSSEKYNCKEIKIDSEKGFDERPNFIYALIKKGIHFIMTEGGITILDLDHPSFKE